MKKPEEINSNILSEIFNLYEMDKETLSFDNKDNSFCQLSDIKEHNSEYFSVNIEDSKNIIQNCLVKKGPKLYTNCSIRIKKINLIFLNFFYYFILEDFILVNQLLKKERNRLILPTPKMERIILKQIKFKKNIFLENYDEDLLYEGEYIIENCLKLNNVIILLKHSNILYLDNKEFYGKLIDKKANLLIAVDKDEYICYIKALKNFDNSDCNEFYLFKNLNFIKLSQDSNVKYYEITNKTTITKIDNEIYEKHRKKIGNFAILKFIYIDFNEQNNIFTCINVGDKFIDINEKIQYVCSVKENIESSYYNQDFCLLYQEKLDKKYCFNSFVYKNDLNRIYCFINNSNINNFCYEIIYLSKKEIYLPKEFYINDKYRLTEYDDFGSKNRRRFNIINSDNIQKLYNKKTKYNSLEIVYLIDENNKTYKYGVFSLNKFDNNYVKKCVIDQNINNILIKYYKEMSNIQSNLEIEKIQNKYSNILTQTQKEYIENKILNEIKIYITFNDLSEFDFYKRIFLFYLVEKSGLQNEIVLFKNLINQINRKDLNLSISSKIRIVNYYVEFFADNKIFPEFIHISELRKQDEYYSLAFKLQKDIIDNFTENSMIFYPILQFNSFSLIKLDEEIPIRGYTVSMERIDIMKKELYNFQDSFFFRVKTENKLGFFANFDRKSGITCINEYRIFKKKDIPNKKDKAFPINLEFTHERLGHGKEVFNNKESPKIYFNGKFENCYIERPDKKEGEAGKVIEKFILDDEFISLFKNIFIFGDFMDYKYFVQSDFNQLKDDVLRKLRAHYPNYFKINFAKNIYNLFKKFLPSLILLLIAVLLKIFKINDYNVVFALFFIVFCGIIFSKNKKKKYHQKYLTDFIIDEESDDENCLIYPDDFVYTSEDSKSYQNKIKQNWNSKKGQKALKSLNFEYFRY